MVDPMLNEQDRKAVAVLATATMHVVGPNAPVVTRLQQLLRDRSHASYEAAAQSFDTLGAEIRERIARTAPGVARQKARASNLTGLLGALNRR